MERDPLASRLAARLRIPIALVGVTAAVMVAIRLMTTWIPEAVVGAAAIAITCAAGAIFLCATFDRRLQNAVAALNAERRAQARLMDWKARLFGIGLPVGDRLLFAVTLALLVVTLAALGSVDHELTFALGFAAFFLVGVSQIALMARSYPTDRFTGTFT